MAYIAQKLDTKEMYFSKGANKIAALIGINPTTVTRNAQKDFTEKVYNGYRFAKVQELVNQDRGSRILRK